MDFTFQNYKSAKIRNYIKKNKIFFFFEGIDQNFSNGISFKQNLKIAKFNSYKIFNKTLTKNLKNSIYLNTQFAIGGNTFLVTFEDKYITKQKLIYYFNSLMFDLLFVKMDNKIYQSMLFRNSYSLNYKTTKLAIFQFNKANLKKQNSK